MIEACVIRLGAPDYADRAVFAGKEHNDVFYLFPNAGSVN